MSGRFMTKTKEKFIRTFERLVEFDKARKNLMIDDEPDVTPEQWEYRAMLLSGQRGDFNYHLWLVQELSRIKGRLEQNGWNGLTNAERTFVRDVARLADVNETRDFSERSLAIAERYFRIGEKANAKLNRVLKILKG